MTTQTLAPKLVRKFVAQYFEATRSNNAQEWASRFANNAIVEDPVGTTPINNSKQILELGKAFMSGFENVGLHEEFVHVIGNDAAARWTGRGLTKEGKQVRFEGINIFNFNSDGKIVNLKGYWSPDEMIEESN
ncbi:SnoaL-like polyketide cyclase [Rivularia sp. PCC 7116]|uniref:nuclear transport factor 2 family protein n=1 Tax=Rivularia sp. PCC 7116 TaxID=373994 RepID=UPI00029F3EE7|nr:nuclear transport factor 2 family protein [Rivularia sp. PCC 7116]AFY57723.1 SnoaL-like polyketide cyclase [Rivularia sp. PCC 7116]